MLVSGVIADAGSASARSLRTRFVEKAESRTGKKAARLRFGFIATVKPPNPMPIAQLNNAGLDKSCIQLSK